jgi:hypothetical protein
MATTIAPTMTHGERILRVLADQRWHTTSNIHRQAGHMVVHSRISELRGKGHEIEHRHVPGKVGAAAHAYRWLNVTDDYRARETPPTMADPGIPNTPANRFRIYTRVYDDLRCVAAAGTPEALGVALVTMGAEGEFDGYLVGLMDRPSDDEPGRWIVKPWCPE